MRPTGGGIRKDPTFSIAYYNNPDTYKKGEMELDFDLNQGVVGSTYQTGTESIAISKNQISGWEDGWNTSETQDKVTNHLNTIVGTPIYKPSQNEEDSKPAAVLIIDSEDSLDSFIDNTTGQSLDEAFKDSELSDELWTHATNIGIIL
jgi:hypothetical protein